MPIGRSANKWLAGKSRGGKKEKLHLLAGTTLDVGRTGTAPGTPDGQPTPDLDLAHLSGRCINLAIEQCLKTSNTGIILVGFFLFLC